jgi:amino-acid N-acetyltransferase
MHASDLRSILQYVPKFRDGVFVVCIEGDVAASENFRRILLDLAVLRSLNIRIILIHGAAHQINALSYNRRVEISDDSGMGTTDSRTLEIAIDATTRLLCDVYRGLTTVNLRAAATNCLYAEPSRDDEGHSLGYTGVVRHVDTRATRLFLDRGVIPVFMPLGYDKEGNCYRLNSDHVAAEVAKAVNARKILHLTTKELKTEEGEFIRYLSVEEAERLLKMDDFHAGAALRGKLAGAAAACRMGVERVHILPGNADGALLNEIFSSEGIGTMIFADDYQQIRRLQKRDTSAIMDLIRESVDSAELVRRNRRDITRNIDDYWVIETDGALMGCVALHVYPEQRLGELACLYIKQNFNNRGYGRKLMHFVEKLALQKGLKAVFALSTQTYSYFERKGGYQVTDADFLPPERRERYEASRRNSKVLVKHLEGQAQGQKAPRPSR